MSLEPSEMKLLSKDRFPSVGNPIHATPTFKHAWATPGYAVIGGYYKSKE